ncbi:glycosyltransferase [Pararoseomonas indoligenes]|uniref:Glycosyltransferase n=1 Tax=Roseomonas indoligenes TaxID=2820811 RepID=A0A940N124_9PROT|nr:glycosyltransferase [Pararoseomonas indoligenes]MBP0495308.1 glycosyltransferase [Pararoseomonas indoligenes]
MNEMSASATSLVASLPDGAEPGLLLQRVVFDRAAALMPLYVRMLRQEREQPAPPRPEGGVLRIPRGATASFDTYFGAFFEHQWRAWTGLRGLSLELRASGRLLLRVLRRTPEGEDVLLEALETEADPALPITLDLPADLPNAHAAGRVFFEVTARGGEVLLRSAAWRAPEAEPAPVGLVPVFCTFNREAALADLLASITGDLETASLLPRLVIVNQGRPGLLSHPAIAALPAAFRERLLVIEQGNFGGAGGFTRGLLAAMEQPGATHALLMDDDIRLEPESLRRAAAFFSIARPGLALGGQMLDGLRPTRLYEAGANIDPATWYLRPQLPDHPLAARRDLDAFLAPASMHYNGWWFFGLPLEMLRQAGLPLPCFIRGDDVEYGRRLHDAGLHTVSLPGVAVWHEPFYARIGGWQLYYETRNMLVTAALHFPRGRHALTWLMFKRLATYLLTYRYYGAALVLQAVRDYLRGPALLEDSPAALHASLAAHKEAHPPQSLPMERVVPPAAVPRDSGGRARIALRLAWALARNWRRPTAEHAAPVRLPMPDLLWFRVTRHDHLVLEQWWDPERPVLRRSREAFRRLFRDGLTLLRRLDREGPAAAEAWRQAFPTITSPPFWPRYLGLPAGE